MVICFVKSVVVYLYLCCSVVISYEAAREIPYYRDRTNQVSKLTGQRLPNRYPNFNKVMTRIENLNDEVNTKSYHHKIRHRGWNKFTTTTTTTTEAGLFETYGDLEDEDYFENYEDILEDEEDEFDYGDEESAEDSFDDTFEDIQAEEPTEAPVKVASVPARPVSSMTEYKWQHYGTMERVQESRRQQLNLPSKEQLKVQAALDHYARVQNQSKCQKPSPKVIPVQQEYPDPSKTYTPHCTVLHRCAEDTGCCKRNTKCQYKSKQVVHLYFYTQTIGSSETKVEKLAFYNHTECECQERNFQHASTESSDSNFKITYKSGNSLYSTSAPSEEECECPKNFELSRSTSRKCACDCEEDNEDCIQLKKGKEHFSLIARVCLQEGRCGLPICEYGDYSLLEGKCPTKKEKLEEYKKVKINY